MRDRRVVITGLGTVTPVGQGIEPFWNALLSERRGVGPITRFDAGGFPCSIGGQLPELSIQEFIPKGYRKAAKILARDSEIALVASGLAFQDAGMATRMLSGTTSGAAPERLGCNIGAGLLCADLQELAEAAQAAVVEGRFDLRAWGTEGMYRLPPLWLLKYLPNMLACHVSIVHGAEGPSNTLTCGDVSGLLSVGEADRWIERGDAEAVVAGGCESRLNPLGLLRQGLLQRLCTGRNHEPASACRPFDRQHDGTVVGEGGGLLLLEAAGHALARDARIYAQVVGFGAACDPQGVQLTRASVGSLDLAIGRSLADAGIRAEEVSLIVAQGTGVPRRTAARPRRGPGPYRVLRKRPRPWPSPGRWDPCLPAPGASRRPWPPWPCTPS